MWGSALWVCLFLEASWQSLGHYRQNLLYSELRNKTQKQRQRSIRLQLLVGDSKIFFVLVIVHSKVQFVFIVYTKRRRGIEKTNSNVNFHYSSCTLPVYFGVLNDSSVLRNCAVSATTIIKQPHWKTHCLITSSKHRASKPLRNEVNQCQCGPKCMKISCHNTRSQADTIELIHVI